MTPIEALKSSLHSALNEAYKETPDMLAVQRDIYLASVNADVLLPRGKPQVG